MTNKQQWKKIMNSKPPRYIKFREDNIYDEGWIIRVNYWPYEFVVGKIVKNTWWRRLMERFGFNMHIGMHRVKRHDGRRR